MIIFCLESKEITNILILYICYEDKSYTNVRFGSNTEPQTSGTFHSWSFFDIFNQSFNIYTVYDLYKIVFIIISINLWNIFFFCIDLIYLIKILFCFPINYDRWQF